MLKVLKLSLYIGLIFMAQSAFSAADAAPGIFVMDPTATVSTTRFTCFWDYLARSQEELMTKQYGYDHPDHGKVVKFFNTGPSIHSYHGAGAAAEVAVFNLPSEALSNVPEAIMYNILSKPSFDPSKLDLCVKITVVQAWLADPDIGGAGRPIALRTASWNDPEAPCYDPAREERFENEVAFFAPSFAGLRLNGRGEGEFHPSVAVTHPDADDHHRIISSPDSDRIVGGYEHVAGTAPKIDLSFWTAVTGPVKRGAARDVRTSLTLHWVISPELLRGLDTLRGGRPILDWALHAEPLGVSGHFAEPLRRLFGI